MSAASEISVEVDQLDRDLRSAKQRVADLRVNVARSRSNKEFALDQLGLDDSDRPLPLAPLIWALFGTICALSAAFSAYITGLMTREHSDMASAWVITLVLIVISVATLGKSARSGAGGSARRTLRFVTMAVGYTVPFALALSPYL